jgi:hypothetical protein
MGLIATVSRCWYPSYRGASAISTSLSLEGGGGCPVRHRRLSRMRSQRSGADLLNHLLLQLVILLDVEMSDIGHFLRVDILQHARELRSPLDRPTISIGDVMRS